MMKTTAAPYLSTSSINVGYTNSRKENRLFENLNLELYPGQLICLMGPNGSGKSSLIRTFAGLQKPLSGEIRINTLSHDRSHQIAVVLTDKINAANLSAYEVIAFGRYPYLNWDIRLSKTDREIIDQSISQVHIEHLIEKKMFELSDGQMQMVMIARALAQNTPLILLDEPTAHLDLNNRVEIMKLLRNLSRTTHKAILVSTHELDLALQMADGIWLTGKEKNIISGFPEDLVLNGAFDSIFQFKGFDLKSGKIQHESHLGIQVQLKGQGAEYLWTKNALERNGFEVTDQSGSIQVSVVSNDTLKWNLYKNGSEISFVSLAELVKSI
jgi:iron complex transport system ATP-binding protein